MEESNGSKDTSRDFSSEQAAYFVPVEIANGRCIAGYVAWAKESVRIDNIGSVKGVN